MNESIRRAEDEYAPPFTANRRVEAAFKAASPAERAILFMELKSGRGIQRPDGFEIGPPLYAYINHGRWIVECDRCSSAQVGSPEDPRYYCLGGTDDGCQPSGLWRNVSYPRNAKAVENLVLVAQKVTERNWFDSGHPPKYARGSEAR